MFTNSTRQCLHSRLRSGISGICGVFLFGPPFVKRFALCYRTVVCLSVCLSVTLVYCGQTVGWIKMKLDMEVGLGPATLS